MKTENEPELFYFGTNLSSAGHYLWKIDNNVMMSLGIAPLRMLPFNPEQMVENFNRGQSRWFGISEYSIWYIEGSCSDDRPGSKTVFFVKGDQSPAELKELILSHPKAVKIIEQCPFKINW